MLMEWTIDGAAGQPIIGDAHVPAHKPIGVALIVHGFLGYKDYGMFPFLAGSFADAGFIAHRFNLSHSGMTNDIASFERPDLFERDTWNKQVFDISRVMDLVDSGALAGEGLPIVLLGHSRGGVSVLLTAGRRFRDGARPLPAGVITLAAPSECDRVSPEAIESLEREGHDEIRSNRTGQVLRVGRAWLDEQRAAPADHDVLALCGFIECPILVAHGEDDTTVPPSCADEICIASTHSQHLLLRGGDHVLITPNPMTPGTLASEPLREFVTASVAFAKRCVSANR